MWFALLYIIKKVFVRKLLVRVLHNNQLFNCQYNLKGNDERKAVYLTASSLISSTFSPKYFVFYLLSFSTTATALKRYFVRVCIVTFSRTKSCVPHSIVSDFIYVLT